MEKLIPKLYKSYGEYVNKKKMLPNEVDGTIPVWKRMMLGVNVVAGKEYTKTAEIVGYVIGHWHPHADSVGAMETLVHNGFVSGKGNWGSKIGSNPQSCAAMRYTSVKMDPIINEIAFKYIKDVEWKEDELKPEPVYIPTMIPFCLFPKYEFNMIAFGFKTEIPNYNLKDLIKRLKYIKDGVVKKGRKVIIKPDLAGCDILSSDAECEKILTTPGRHTLSIKGRYEEHADKHRIYITGWNPRTSFQALFNQIDKYKKWDLFSSGDVSYIDESARAVGTRVRLQVARSRGKDEIYEKLREAVDARLVSNIGYSIFVVKKDGSISESCVDSLLLSAYDNYKSVLVTHHKNRIVSCKAIITELKIIAKIRPHIKAVSSLSADDAIEKLSELTSVPKELISQIISKYNIKKLITVNTDISDVEAEIKGHEKSLSNIDQVTMDDYDNMLSKL